jgi:tRNA-dihydrouridine synthase C
MLRTTNCDALMIGRGSVINPFIFHQIRAHFAKTTYTPKWEDLMKYLDTYLASMSPETPLKLQVNKLKQLLGFLFKGNGKLLEYRQTILTSIHPDPHSLFEYAKNFLLQNWAV